MSGWSLLLKNELKTMKGMLAFSGRGNNIAASSYIKFINSQIKNRYMTYKKLIICLNILYSLSPSLYISDHY